MDESSIKPIDLTESDNQSENTGTPVRSLRDLLDRVTGRNIHTVTTERDSGMAEILPFPFLAIIGQREMKIALLLALVNHSVGGVLLIGPRGTGKTTSVRSLVDLLPQVPRSLCYYGCMLEDIESGGIDAVCPDCAKKYAEGEPLTILDFIHLIELPLNSRLEDVVGGIDERSALHQRMRLRRGILSQADRNILYVDEINLLSDDIVDALLDAAAQGRYTVRRGPVSATYRSNFILIGSMNPEEGQLRPQIQDRFGLRVIVRGLTDDKERLEAYHRVQAYLENPHQVLNQFYEDSTFMRNEIQEARERLPAVHLPNEVACLGLEVIDKLKIDSLRAEITLFEAARAYAAIDSRDSVLHEDLRQVAPMALRLRRSRFITEYFSNQQVEDNEINDLLNKTISI